jgi:MFS family permease
VRGAGRPLLFLRSRVGLLAILLFCNTFGLGGFNPLLPEIGRAQGMANWQIGLLASAFGFARMAAAMPTGAFVARRLGTALVAAPLVLISGLLFLVSGGPFWALIAGRLLLGVAHTLAMVGGLTAILVQERGRNASVRLNVFEFAGMLGILGGLGTVALVPAAWGWKISLLIGSSPVLIPLLLTRTMRRAFPSPPMFERGLAPTERTTIFRQRPGSKGVIALMFAVGIIFALAWAGVSQFVVPIRGARDFGLSRTGISWLLAAAQSLDLLVLLPVGRIADRVGRGLVLGMVAIVLGLGALGVGLGSFVWFALGCICLGLALAGWMLPLGVIREHTPLARLAWTTGLYRVGVDGASFLGPFICGFLGPSGEAVFLTAIGVTGLALGVRLLWRPTR